MRLTIKTLDQKTFHVDFEESKTVWDLKLHLFERPEVGVQPEQQQLIYAGRVLDNGEELKTYSIDERRFLVVMAKKSAASQPKEDKSPKPATSRTTKPEVKTMPVDPQQKPICAQKPQPTVSTPTKIGGTPPRPGQAASTSGTTLVAPTPVRSPSAQNLGPRLAPVSMNSNTLLDMLNASPTVSCDERLVREIVNMGYAEGDVRRALIASFNNADRAIEYLIEGIPEFDDLTAPEQTDTRREGERALDFLREDPRFDQMRTMIQQRPEMLSMLLAKIGETNPGLLDMIRQNQDEFLQMLNESDNDDRPSNPNPNPNAEYQVTRVQLTEAEHQAVNRLVDLGFPRNMVLQAYIACDKNEEQTADFLCRHMEDE